MQIQFRAAADGPLPRLQAQIVDQDSLPEGIEPALKEGAAAARFAGKTGQVFEAFVTAPSKGTFFNAEIRDAYAYEELEQLR